MKLLIEKKTLLIASIIVLLAIGSIPFAYIMFSPEFPDSVPSAAQQDEQQNLLQQQTRFFYRFTRYLRLNHGGIVEADIVKSPELEAQTENAAYASFKQRFKYIHDNLLIDLIRNFSQEEKIVYRIKKYVYKNKDLNKPDSYEVLFYKEESPWVSVKLEWADENLQQERQQIQYTEVTEHSKIDQEEPEVVEPLKDKAKLVIVIDDLGNNMDVFRNLIQLNYEITYAILPQLPFSLDTAEIVNKAGHDVMLHLPMQPKDWPKYNPGNGALFLDDSAESIQQKMDSNLRSVPYIVGVNNHMGSAYTQYSQGLDVLMRILNSRNLFFMDSKTAPGDIAKNAARKFDVRYLSRNIFLDNLQQEEYVTNQLYKAAKIAKKAGRAIAIGHPYPITYQVLAKHLPLLNDDGIQITRVSEIVAN